MNGQVNTVGQTINDQTFERGIALSGPHALGVNPELGLIAMAEGDSQAKDTPAHKAIEVLLDDIQLNLSPDGGRTTIPMADSLTTFCLRESVDNINDYLFSNMDQWQPRESYKGVGLAAMLPHGKRLSYTITGDTGCFLFSDNQLIDLNASADKTTRLGLDSRIKPEVSEVEFHDGDILIMISADALNCTGSDFIRVTLSRFGDNLERVLRQINTRTKRNGLEHRPDLILHCS
ncbi:MAG: hypothetical protein DRR06_05210 [Gammaproteobacteria bacterium]|nr:MAG: hypothetical protein DRR42_18935 [Gammaproteobacteria bacterium]RLA46389.1 MAG: hypothetical protein DRR06_05210 [Gammaproteobacteria bacterium]